MSKPPSAVRLVLCAAVLLACAGCASRSRSYGGSAGSPSGDITLNRGDWIVGQQTGVWKVEVPGATQASAPVRLGYMTSRIYREVRGGPTFTMYEVTTTDRKEVVGMVDTLGNATRFAPRRNAGPEAIPVGNATLPLSVQAIFETLKPVTLVPTTERDLAFEKADINKDGFLDATEFPPINRRPGSPDKNRDGKVDRQEFELADDL